MMVWLRNLLGSAACAALLVTGTGCAAFSDEGEDDESADREDALRVCPDATTIEGIDVSYYQETVDWNAVKQAGREFAFLRVSDGTKHPDSRFDQNWAGAKAAGVIRGAYQFFRPAQSAEVQADMMVEAVGQLGPGDLPAVIDVETADGQSSAVRPGDPVGRRFHGHQDRGRIEAPSRKARPTPTRWLPRSSGPWPN